MLGIKRLFSLQLRTFFVSFSLLVLGYSHAQQAFPAIIVKKHSARLQGTEIMAFNDLPEPEGWGENLVYQVDDSTADTRTMGPLDGLLLVDIWNRHGGIAVFNTTTHQEPFQVEINYDSSGVTLTASGRSNIEVFRHSGDYYDAIWAFALKMKQKGLSVQPAPNWAFDPIWETYGFEENYNVDTIKSLLPILNKLGIKIITIDSGRYGSDRGSDLEFGTGDYTANTDIIGSENEWIEFIAFLQTKGFRVRLWWVPGVAEKETVLWRKHPKWFSSKVISSSGDTEDDFWHPRTSSVQDWNNALIRRFLSYAVDGFKQDDIYNYVSKKANDQIAYANLINNNLRLVKSFKKDFVINTCNCSIAQNFYLFPGQNQLIVSGPVGSKQIRRRAKYLQALNVNGAAILGNHIDLSNDDIGPNEMDEPGFYDTVNFHSVVPLGLVLQTKSRSDPGPLYRKWFRIYNKYKFYDAKWINLPLISGELEMYLLRDNNILYFSVFPDTSNAPFKDAIQRSHLTPGSTYKVIDILKEQILKIFTAKQSNYSLALKLSDNKTLAVLPIDKQTQ